LTYQVRQDGLPTGELLGELVGAARERGESEIQVETTREAGDAWTRAGFTEVMRTLTASVDALEARLGPAPDPSFGSIHVQTDDIDAVERAVRQFVPRLPGGSKGSAVLPPRDGWVGVFDELTDREPEMLRRLGRELSDRMGAFVLALGAEEGRVVRYIAYERGRVVDEYLSVPEFHGPLPPGEVIALGANPRLMARMTGADAEAIRATARTAANPADLPPASELIVQIADLFGIPAAEGGYEQAVARDDAIFIER
jgi:hypothetical protein